MVFPAEPPSGSTAFRKQAAIARRLKRSRPMRGVPSDVAVRRASRLRDFDGSVRRK